MLRFDSSHHVRVNTLHCVPLLMEDFALALTGDVADSVSVEIPLIYIEVHWGLGCSRTLENSVGRVNAIAAQAGTSKRNQHRRRVRKSKQDSVELILDMNL